MSTERETLRLHDIVENIERIEGYVANLDFAGLTASAMTVDAIERCLQRITEAVIKIGPERKAAISPQTPIDAVRGLGNTLRHDYDGVDLRVIWKTVRESLPELKADCMRAIGQPK